MSKELEALKEFKGNNNTILVGRVMGKQHYLDCLQAIEKSLKALEIIKELLFKNCKIELVSGGSYYQIIVKIGKGHSFGMSISKEEFNTLKEVLKNG